MESTKCAFEIHSIYLPNMFTVEKFDENTELLVKNVKRFNEMLVNNDLRGQVIQLVCCVHFGLIHNSQRASYTIE